MCGMDVVISFSFFLVDLGKDLQKTTDTNLQADREQPLRPSYSCGIDAQSC
jgi:hypothetical protein